MLPKAAQQQ